MNVDLNPDQLRVYVNLKSRITYLRESDMAGWSPEELALAESWYHAGGDIKSPDVPHFIAAAHAAATTAANKAWKAELESAVRALVAAAAARDESARAFQAACKRLEASGIPKTGPIFCDGHVITRDERFNSSERFFVRKALTV